MAEDILGKGFFKSNNNSNLQPVHTSSLWLRLDVWVFVLALIYILTIPILNLWDNYLLHEIVRLFVPNGPFYLLDVSTKNLYVSLFFMTALQVVVAYLIEIFLKNFQLNTWGKIATNVAVLFIWTLLFDLIFMHYWTGMNFINWFHTLLYLQSLPARH